MLVLSTLYLNCKSSCLPPLPSPPPFVWPSLAHSPLARGCSAQLSRILACTAKISLPSSMAAACPLILRSFFCCILLQTICCSGASVELSYDSAPVKALSSSAVTGYRVTVTDKRRAYYHFLKPFACRDKPCRSEPLAAAGSFVNEAIAGANRHELRGTLQPFQVDTEAEANGDLAVDEGTQEAVAEVAALLGADAGGVVLHVKSSVAPSAVAMGTGREKRLLGVLVDVSSPRRRELGEARATARDEFSPVSNPAKTPVSNPVTVPATNPMSPGFVTVPSTNPGNGFATNPNLPPLYPEPTTPGTMPMPNPATTPVIVPTPFTNPVAAPITMPGTAVTNPATTPTQFPGTSPVTNPVTTYPYPQQGFGGGGMPATTPPAVYQPPATTMPGTVQPGAPTVAGQGQAWCVAKSGLMDTALQDGIDYACGAGGADCSAIQPMGACYNPNTLQAHASYAFNSYFQRNPSAASCDFGGAGMLVNVNPSSGTCMYQTAAGFGAGYSPGTTGGGVPSGYTPGMSGAVGGGSGSTVLNANDPGGNSMYGAYDNPTGLTAGGSASLPFGGRVVLCLIWMVTFAFVREKV